MGARVSAVSWHGGYVSPPPRPFTAEGATDCAMQARGSVMQNMKALRHTLDAAGCSHIAISADEWGVAPWHSRHFGVVHGINAAGFLAAAAREAQATNLLYSNYFEPVNEGAIAVRPFSSSLTSVGQVMRLFGRRCTRLHSRHRKHQQQAPRILAE